MCSRAAPRGQAEGLEGVLADLLSVKAGSQMDDGLSADPSLEKLWVKLWMEKGEAHVDWPCSLRTGGQLRQHGAEDKEMRRKQTRGEDGQLRR